MAERYFLQFEYTINISSLARVCVLCICRMLSPKPLTICTDMLDPNNRHTCLCLHDIDCVVKMLASQNFWHMCHFNLAHSSAWLYDTLTLSIYVICQIPNLNLPLKPFAHTIGVCSDAKNRFEIYNPQI